MSTHLQTQTTLQPPPQPTLNRLPPSIEAALKQQLVEAAIRSGKVVGAELLDTIVESLWAVVKHDPETLRQRLVGLFPPEQANAWHQTLTQLQATTMLHPDPPPQPAATPVQSLPTPSELDADLLETVQWLQSLGIDDLKTAMDWAKSIHGQLTSRPLEPSELAQIQEVLNAKQIQNYLEPLPSPSPVQPLPVLQPPSLLASHSPFVHLMQIGVVVALLGVVFQLGALNERRTADVQIKRVINWANCVVNYGSAACINQR